MRALLLSAALLLPGCVSPEQGRAVSPAAGLTVEVKGDGATLYFYVYGDGNLTGTAAPDNASSGSQETDANKLKVPLVK